MRSNLKLTIVALVALAVGLFSGYYLGNVSSKAFFSRGYRKAQTDFQKTQGLAAQQALRNVVQASSPFKVNPLPKINPLDKAKDLLNPFK